METALAGDRQHGEGWLGSCARRIECAARALGGGCWGAGVARAQAQTRGPLIDDARAKGREREKGGGGGGGWDRVRAGGVFGEGRASI